MLPSGQAVGAEERPIIKDGSVFLSSVFCSSHFVDPNYKSYAAAHQGGLLYCGLQLCIHVMKDQFIHGWVKKYVRNIKMVKSHVKLYST